MSAVAHIREYKTGKFYSDEFRRPMSWNGYENNVLLRNLGPDESGTPQFVDVAMAVGADDILDSRGVAAADFDNDGDLDLVVNHNPGDPEVKGTGVRPALLRNDLGNERSWLAVELVGTTGNRDGVGALVTATAELESGEATQTRVAKAGTGYASQESSRLVFGLARAEAVRELTVTWPAGTVQRFADVPARHLVRITEGKGAEGLELLELPGTAGPGPVPELRLVGEEPGETKAAPAVASARPVAEARAERRGGR